MKKGISVEAVALDFDGVLIDSQPLHLLAWEKTLDAYGLGVESLGQRILGVSVHDFVRSLNLDENTGQSLIAAKKEQLLSLAQSHVPKLYPKVSETLHFLSTRVDLALVSSAEPELVATILKHHRLESLFNAIVLEGDYRMAKPDPEPYQIAIKRLQVPPERTAAVEDSPVGIQSALAAGLLTIAITNTAAEESLKSADIIIHAFSQLPQALLIVDREGGKSTEDRKG